MVNRPQNGFAALFARHGLNLHNKIFVITNPRSG
jgi:hypothetical protein